MGGEGQWGTTFTNNTEEAAIVGLTPNRPAKVLLGFLDNTSQVVYKDSDCNPFDANTDSHPP
jgi:hypothetical protein